MQADPIKAVAQRSRGGRPRAEDAGDVDRRILDAAQQLFLRLGFDATSCEQVVALAGAGKASLYARYANKEALFAAVVRDNVERTLEPVAPDLPDLPLQARLAAVGRSIVRHTLQPDVIALMRVVLSTAHRMPELARLADQYGRDRAVQRVVATIAGSVASAAGESDHALHVANKFIELAFVPTQMRALLGDDAGKVMLEADRRIDETVELMTKGGWLEGWM